MTGKLSVEQAQVELLRRVRTEGVFAAYEASLSICSDPKAPAPARASASQTLFRVAGFFNKENSGADEKAPHQMDGHELQTVVRRLERDLKSREKETKDIFE